MSVTIEQMAARWSDPASRPLFRGRLIDNDGCCCAQGDVLRLCGWSDEQLRTKEQGAADREVAQALGISLAHSVLLRQVNDSVDGCPQDVLTHPERILGDQAPRILAFWRLLDGMSLQQRGDAWDAARIAAWDAAVAAAGVAAWTARDAVWGVAGDEARIRAGATNEIQGDATLKTFCFLPLFGISDPSELDGR